MLIPNAPRALKMACGENPKRVYGSSGVQPDSRLGIGWLQRKQWYKAAVRFFISVGGISKVKNIEIEATTRRMGLFE